MKTKLTVLFAAALLSGLAAYGPWRASAATLIVDDNSACAGATFTSIQAAVNAAAPNDTIQVCAGTYNEDVTIPVALVGLTLQGAQAGNPVGARTAGGAAESTVRGQITVHAADVTIDGFSLTNPAEVGPAFGILVKSTGSDALIAHNIIDSVISIDAGAQCVLPAVPPACTTGQSTAQGIYLENGPDNVTIRENRISNIRGDRSTKGIFIGDSLSGNPSLNILIAENTIEDITSVTRGAYGVQVNNGASTAPAATGFTEVVILDNIIDDLSGGGWAHAIGLEGDTPVARVEGNCISDVVDLTPAPVNDAIAVWFEANPSFSLGEVHQNNFDRVEFGIAVHPALTGAPVDGANNWWGAADGPGPVGPGSGAKVSPNVIYTPWLIAPALGGACGGEEVQTKDQCKNGGWQNFFRANGTSFKNQGDCIQYVNTGK